LQSGVGFYSDDWLYHASGMTSYHCGTNNNEEGWMPMSVELSDCGHYVQTVLQGPIDIALIKAARTESLPLFFGTCDRALVDFRLAETGHISFIDVDDLCISFKEDVPRCNRMVMVISPDADKRRYAYLANAHCIAGVETDFFENMGDARAWLLERI
jgi:hypothetical protein